MVQKLEGNVRPREDFNESMCVCGWEFSCGQGEMGDVRKRGEVKGKVLGKAGQGPEHTQGSLWPKGTLAGLQGHWCWAGLADGPPFSSSRILGSWLTGTGWASGGSGSLGAQGQYKTGQFVAFCLRSE